LISYSVNPSDQLRQAALYIDRVIKGTAPAADLPLQQPKNFDLVAAKALGLAVPPLLLARADEVIE
jgi:putative tryptophan/tyrosine transport system substrate-binding protein